jgi:hypothetical protein
MKAAGSQKTIAYLSNKPDSRIFLISQDFIVSADVQRNSIKHQQGRKKA